MKRLEMTIILEIICAFLNSEGGILYIGITDDGRIEGIQVNRKYRDEFCLQLDFHLRKFEPIVIN